MSSARRDESFRHSDASESKSAHAGWSTDGAFAKTSATTPATAVTVTP